MKRSRNHGTDVPSNLNMPDNGNDIIVGSKILGEDGLNNMPAEMIDTILGCMPLRDAVRTSVLSRGWRNRWKSVPTLILFQLAHNKEFENLAYHVLHQHHGFINTVHLGSFCIHNNTTLDYLMRFLPTSKIQDFALGLHKNEDHVMAPALYSFHNLMHLRVVWCAFHPPPEFRGFRRLHTLYFNHVKFNTKSFADFISLCFLLERVTLCNCTGLGTFEVKGPCLRFFSLKDGFDTITFKNSPVLSAVSLSTSREPFNNSKYFQFQPTLEKLRMNPTALELLDAGRSIPFPECLNSLKVLDLNMSLDHVREVECALLLARRSPHLQMLDISLRGSIADHQHTIHFLRNQETPDHTLDHIKKVEIFAFGGSEAQIEFVGFLLNAAAGLEELEITLYDFGPETRSAKAENVMQFPRASPSVTVRLNVEIVDDDCD